MLATTTLEASQMPNILVIQTPSVMPIPATKTETPANLVSLNTLSSGEYLVIRGFDSRGKKYALHLITSEGTYIGKLDEGHDFAYAAISPNHEWLAYVDGINENSTLHVKTISTNEDYRLMRGCEYPSWSPDGKYLTAACKEISAFSYSDGEWKQVGNIPLPDEFSTLPESAKEAVQLVSPSWSSDGKSIAYLAIFFALQPRNSVLGPYISPASCLFDKATCDTYELDLGEIHPWPTLQWLQSSNRIALYSLNDNNNRSELYLFDVSTKELTETISLANDRLVDSFVFSPSDEFLAFKPSADSAYIMNTVNGILSKIIAPVQNDRLQTLFWIEIP